MIQFSYEELIRPYLCQAKNWQLKFAIVPHRCSISGKRIWLEDAYRGTRSVRHGDHLMLEHFWVKFDEFIIWNLKGRT
jgi:hypothetical protein